jgi:hypothetical protein
MSWVITQKLDNNPAPGIGDTDTSAAISGALLGARDGYEKFRYTC